MNCPYLLDSVEFFVKPHVQKSNQIRDLYVKGGFSAAQIAARIGCSKSTILDRLAKEGLLSLKKNSNVPNNYRNPQAPFGYRVVERMLVLDKREMQICKLVVRLRNENEKNFSEIAKELMNRGLKNRFGKTSWNYMMAQKIYKRWNGKV